MAGLWYRAGSFSKLANFHNGHRKGKTREKRKTREDVQKCRSSETVVGERTGFYLSYRGICFVTLYNEMIFRQKIAKLFHFCVLFVCLWGRASGSS